MTITARRKHPSNDSTARRQQRHGCTASDQRPAPEGGDDPPARRDGRAGIEYFDKSAGGLTTEQRERIEEGIRNRRARRRFLMSEAMQRAGLLTITPGRSTTSPNLPARRTHLIPWLQILVLLSRWCYSQSPAAGSARKSGSFPAIKRALAYPYRSFISDSCPATHCHRLSRYTKISVNRVFALISPSSPTATPIPRTYPLSPYTWPCISDNS
jgi:hypothetical protein